jgi:MYXO-CTERM domain-containing protein
MNDGGLGGLGGGGGAGGGAGGAGGELIGVAQEADSLCCCSIAVNGSMNCHIATICPPYTTNTPGACDTGTGTGTTCFCSAGVGSASGGVNAVEVFVLFLALALAAFRAMRRRFA